MHELDPSMGAEYQRTVQDLSYRHATPSGTAALTSRFSAARFRRLGDLSLSSIGWSTSRRAGSDSAASLLYAFRRGVNVFDLVPYCREGAAEQAMATALAPPPAGERLPREEVVLANRVGFLNEAVADFGLHVQRIEGRYISRGLLAWEDLALGNHCIAPGFLRHALDASLARLGTSIDVLFLASPSTQLAIVDLATLEKRLRRAFEELEACVADGKIGCYGVADPGALQLERVLTLAAEAGGPRHHLRVLQFPLDLHGSAKALRAEQMLRGHAVHILQAARELGLYVFVSGAISSGGAEYEMEADARATLGPVVTDRQLSLQWARSLPGVGTALCGMRRSAHIDENCAVLDMAPADEDAVQAFLPEGVTP